MSWFEVQDLTWFQKLCIKILQCGKIPEHVAFILDGNRRYAKKLKTTVEAGHVSGFDTLSRTLDWCRHIGIKEVTVYTFSIENFKRSKEEVNELMALAKNKFEELLKEKERVKENGIRIKVIGNISLLPEDLQRLIARVHLMTAGNDRAILNIAMAYTSKEEMTHAMEEIFWGTREDLLVPSDVDDDLINQCLYTWESNHPDLLIRTSGEVRLSDFMLWQTAYSCLHFSSVLWPEYSFWELTKAILHYQVVHPTIQEAKYVASRKCRSCNQLDPEKKNRIDHFINKLREKEDQALKSIATM
ncbi:dehydrodolichyl diphosphate synthase complex subunit DHDDS-like [Artemia franciscana]|uniref:dehydrodolichyl diphosphate synthase complex subunit DHDDS-like n=1 Tax=Artemia franciscana TaxID=6661 RepID=UPI0032DA4B41